ncbi:DUF885 family protein [Ideonella sp. A 288]|uniref:DUF885 domain-containing protein n=1 Tax=Ideonella sp. A 288 TaxID=1962181 RepID=UPI000B4BB287|nr:DUF885 domain-containing protein [Ideonella sp. A 288]
MNEQTQQIAPQALATLAEHYWAFECRELPLSAVLAGQTLHDAVLFRESAADHQRRDNDAGHLLALAEQIDAGPLNAQERATLALIKRELAGLRAQHAVDSWQRPWLFPAGPDFTAMFWANSTSLTDAAAAALYVDRLAGLPAYLRDVQSNIEAGHARGYRYPRVVLQSAAANTRGILGAIPEASAWMSPFQRSPAAAQPGVRAQSERALGVVRDALLPALQAWADFVESLVERGARESLSCVDGPAGAAYYRTWLQHFTSTTADPEEVHALGLAEVARLERDIQAVAGDAGHAGDVPGYRAFLASDPQFIAPSRDALRESIEALCKRVDRRIPEFFGLIPRITYGVQSIPDAVSARMPPAYAQPSPADGTSAGIFWISGLPSKAPSYLHPALVVHEAWPGHLMHMALMNEQTELPAFRRYGAVKYTACVEGWALYCETLGVEMGLYTTPHEHYGRLEMEMWRAVRLVVDTGIHVRGWSREQAVAYMSERLSLSRETIEGEVDRYAALPAQALGYQIGNLKFRELRRRAEATLGTRFRHRDFHAAVMNAGAVTLPVLDDLVSDWLRRQTSALGKPDEVSHAP